MSKDIINIRERFTIEILKDDNISKIKVTDNWLESLFCFENSVSYILNVKEKYCLNEDVDNVVNEFVNEFREKDKEKIK